MEYLHSKEKWKIMFSKWREDLPLYGFAINIGVKNMSVMAPCAKKRTDGLPPEFFTQKELEANAEMICKAVNTLPLLVKSLTYVTEQLEKHSTQLRELTTKNKKGYAEIDVDVLAFILQDIANGTKAALQSAKD